MSVFTITGLIVYLLQALIWIIIVDCVLTFIPSVDRRNSIVVAIRNITEPMYDVVRRIIPSIRSGGIGLDLAPLIVIIALNLIIRIVAHF
ncbi:MAG: YggT family protein [Armatimonadetes bacterium]|nr:YggT family protein [Armatimonadota bacterium]